MLHSHTVYFWILYYVQFSCSVLSNSATPGTAAHQPSLSITQLLELAQTHVHWVSDDIQPSSVVLLLLSSILPSIRVFSNESVLCIRWSKYWSFSFSISPSNEHPGLISFKMDWLDLLSVQWTLKSLLQHHSLKASILQCSAFFLVELSHPYNYWKNHSFDYTYLCGQSNVSAF